MFYWSIVYGTRAGIHAIISAHDLMPIQIANRRSRLVNVGVFEEAEAFGFPGVLVVNQAKTDYGANMAEDVADLFFADAWCPIVSAWVLECRKILRDLP